MYSKFESLLQSRGITAYRVSRDTGIAGATLTNWKKGGYTPKIDKLQTLADYFGVPLSYFTDNDNVDEQHQEEHKKIPKELKKILEEEEVALNGRMMSDQDKKFILGIIEATYRELQEMDSRSKK